MRIPSHPAVACCCQYTALLLAALSLPSASAAAAAAAAARKPTSWQPLQEQHICFEASGADGIRVAVTAGSKAMPPDGQYPSALQPRKPCRPLGHGESLTNGNLRASVTDAGLLTFHRISDGSMLLQEQAPRNFTATADRGYFAVDLALRAYEGEALYGLGQHKTGALDNKGQTFNLRPANTEILIPVVHSSRGYSFVWNLPSFGTFASTNESTHWHATSAPLLDFWVCTTSANLSATQSPWADRMAKFSAAVGRAPLFPDWVSGCTLARPTYHIRF